MGEVVQAGGTAGVSDSRLLGMGSRAQNSQSVLQGSLPLGGCGYDTDSQTRALLHE